MGDALSVQLELAPLSSRSTVLDERVRHADAVDRYVFYPGLRVGFKYGRAEPSGQHILFYQPRALSIAALMPTTESSSCMRRARVWANTFE